MLSVSTDAAGWTVVTPPKDARVIYVSSSTGDNANSGTSPAGPLKTIAAGISLLRDGTGDQLLLRRGDTWHESLGMWRKSGRSASEPLVVGAYGTGDRPLLMTGAGPGFSTGASSSPEVDHVDLIGLHFYANARDPASPSFRTTENVSGLQLMARTDGLLIEDCSVQAYGTNVVIQEPHGPVKNVTIRRSAILDAYAVSAHSQGIFADGVSGLTLEENVFDHNGWNDAVKGAAPTIFNHDAYLTNTTSGVVVHGNVFANAASHGLQARGRRRRAGQRLPRRPHRPRLRHGQWLARHARRRQRGRQRQRLHRHPRHQRRQARHRHAGGQHPPRRRHDRQQQHLLRRHPGRHRRRPALAGSQGFPAISLTYGNNLENPGQAVGLNDLTVQGNIVYRWSAGLSVQGGVQPGGSGLKALNRLSFRDNDFQKIRNGPIIQHAGALDSSEETWSGGRYDGTGSPSYWVTVEHRAESISHWDDKTDAGGRAMKPAYADPARSAASYDASLGGDGTTDGFLAVARTQSSQTWQPQFTAAGLIQNVRDGFAETGQPARDWRAPTPPAAVATVPDTVTTADTSLTFTVAFTDDKAVDVSSITSGSVHLTGRDASLPATLVSVAGSGPGPVVATYRVDAPHTVWRRTDRGSYSVTIDGGQVKDTDGFAVPAGRLAKVKLDVLQAPKPPTVKKLKFHGKSTRSITVQFSSNVSSTLTASALTLTAQDGSTIDPSLLSMTYDPKRNVATWTFPALPNAVLPAGPYRVTLSAATIADAGGRHLDGNRDGLGGDDFVSAKVYKSKG